MVTNKFEFPFVKVKTLTGEIISIDCSHFNDQSTIHDLDRIVRERVSDKFSGAKFIFSSPFSSPNRTNEKPEFFEKKLLKKDANLFKYLEYCKVELDEKDYTLIRCIFCFDKNRKNEKIVNLSNDCDVESNSNHENTNDNQDIDEIEIVEPTPFTGYLNHSNGLNAIKDFSKNFPNSKSANALNILSERVQLILSSNESDEKKLSDITTACINAKNSIPGFTLFSSGMHVIHNFMEKTMENAKKHAAKQDNLEDSLDDKNWVKL